MARRVGTVGLLALVALSGLQCMQDLVVSPPQVKHEFSVAPDRDTLPIVGPQGDPIAFPFTPTLTADGAPVRHGIAVRVLHGDSVVLADSAGRLLVRGRGEALLQVRPRNVALPDTLADTVSVLAVVPRIGLDPARTVDTLASLHDTLLLRAVALTTRGDTIAGVPVPWAQVSGQVAVALLNGATGQVRADSEGTAVFRASVDLVDTVRAVVVRQRPARVALSSDTLVFHVGGQVKAATAQVQDARSNAIAGATATWASPDTTVVKLQGPGLLEARNDGTVPVAVSFTRDGATATKSLIAVVRRAHVTILSGDDQTGIVTGLLGAPLVVQLADALGAVAEPNVAVTFHVSGGGAHFGTPTDTLRTDTTVVTDAQGRAAVTPRLGRASGVATFTATGAGLAGAAAAFSATGAPAPASQVAFQTPPATRTAGTTFAPAVEVVLRDTLGNVATTTTKDVTLTITPATNPGGATLAGTVTVTSSNGVATFADLRIRKAGAGYTLTASATGLPSAASAAFDIDAGPPATIAVTPASVTVTAGPAQAFVADVRDSVGNAASGGVRWKSLNGQVASIDSIGGSALGQQAGQTAIVATAGSLTAYALLTVSSSSGMVVDLWVATPSGTAQPLSDVWGSDTSNVFAVGANGTILRGTGASWSAMGGAAAGDSLQGVWGTSSADVFAVGRNGRVLHYGGSGSWTALSGIASTDHLFGVWGSSPRDVFATGATAGGVGVVYHYDGAAWTRMSVPATGALRGVWGSAANDVFVTGAGGVVLHYDGTTWAVSLAARGDRDGWRVWGSAANQVVATANTVPGGLLVVREYDGAAWTETGTTVASFRSGLWGETADQMYVATDSAGPFVHYDGTTWAPMGGARGTPMAGVWCTSTGPVWMVGQGGTVYHGYRNGNVGVAPVTVGLAAIGRTRQLTATVSAGSTPLAGVPVTWSSSNPASVSVDATGLVTAVATGSATVTATAQGGASAVATVGVTPIAVSLDLTPPSATLAAGGATRDLIGVAVDSTAHRILGRQPTWTALIPGVATVATVNDTTARVTALGAGQTVVRADLDNLSTSALVTAAASGLQPVNVWQIVRPAPDTALAAANFYGAWATSDSTVIVAGNPRSYRFDGSAWHEIAELRSIAVYRVAGPSPARVWAVGGTGALWGFDGTSWTALASGTPNTLANLWVASERDVFAAGANATMLRYDGSAWTAMPMPGSATASYSGLWGFSSSDVWVTGAANELLHWDGTAWSVTSLTGAWQGLWGSAPNDVFAVGNAGAIAHYNGTTWSPMSSPTLENLRRVWGSSPTDVYAAGSNGTVLRYDGSSWVVMPTYQSGRLVNGVFGTPRGTVWAVGGTGPALVLRGYRGGSVTVSPTSATLHALGAAVALGATVRDAGGGPLPDVPLRWTSTDPTIARVDSLSGTVTAVRNGSVTVRATAAGGAYASVSVTVLQVSKQLSIAPASAVLAGAGTTQALTVTAQDSLGNAMPSPTLTWSAPNATVATVSGAGIVTAVGTGQLVVTATDGGAIGSALVTVGVPAASPVNLWAAQSTNVTGTLLAVWGASPSDLFGVGSGGTIVHSDGSIWSSMSSGTTNTLYAAWGTAHGDVFAVGVGGTVLHFDGASWTAMPSGTTQTLFSVWGTSRANVYAAGAAGTLLHYDGAAWSAVATGLTVSLRAVWGTSASDVFVAGTAGTILHFDGSSWTAMSSGTTAPLYGLWGVSAGDVYAVSTTGILLHYNGSAWSVLNTNPGLTIRALTGTAGSDLYAVGTGIVAWSGSAWTPMASGTSMTLYGAWVSGSSQLYVVGGAGVALRGVRGATVALSAPGWTTTAQGTQQQVAATATDAAGAPVSGVTFAWTTGNPAVATVDGTGLLTAVDTGSTNVTATAAGGASATIPVTVSALGNTMRVTPAGAALSGVGSTQALVAEVRDASGNVVASPSVTWASLDPAVATVDAATGLVTAAGAGQARLVATSGGLSGYAVVTVSVPALLPVNVWAPMTSGTAEILHDIWGTAATDVWAAGENAALALHYDGTQWRTALSGIGGVTQYYGMSVGGTSTNDVFVGTDGGNLLARFDGASWSTLTAPAEYGNAGTVVAVWAASPRETYFGITSTYGGTAGGVARYNQGAWTRVQGPTSVARLWGAGAGDLFVAGSTGTLWRCTGGVCAGSATPSGANAIRGLWGTGPTRVFAVGGGSGYVITYDGSAWTQLPGVPAVALNGITGGSAADVYAVGNGGAIVRYDGTNWTSAASGTTANLNQAWTTPTGDVMVAGDGGTILWGVRGGTVTVSTPSGTAIGIGASRQLTATAYAAGAPLPGVPFTWASSDTTIARVAPTSGLVTGVASGSATITATAAGGATSTLGVTVSSSAATVATVSVSPPNPTLTGYGATQQLTATARDAANDVVTGVSFTWSSGNTAVATVGSTSGLVTAVHTGTAGITATAAGGKTGSVTVTVAPGATATVAVAPAGSALSGAGATQALAVQVHDVNGDLVASPTAAWASLNPNVATVDAATGLVTAVAPGQAVITATSSGGTGAALVTVSAPAAAPVNLWLPMQTATYASASGIWGTSASDLWAVSGVNALHYDGATWTGASTGSSYSFTRIWGASSTDIFAVGGGGTIYHYDGASWTAMTTGTTQALQDVWGSSGKDVFAVGPSGTVVHYDGTAWTTMSTGSTATLYAVWGASRADVWAAGSSGTVLHYDGTGWASVPSGTSQLVYGLWGASGTDVYAVTFNGASSGQILYWNGTTWTLMTSTLYGLYGVWGTSPSDVYAVGYGGWTYRYDGSTWRIASTGAGTLARVWGAGVGDLFAASSAVAGQTAGVVRGVRGATLAIDASAPWAVTAAGNQRQLGAAVSVGGSPLAGVALTWVSRNNAVATVNGSGLLTATGLGSVYVVVSAAGGLTDSVSVTVSRVANTVNLVPSSVTLGAGSTQGLIAQVRDTSGNLVAASVTYASLNPAVATVDLTGTVTAVEAGQAVIVATTGGGLTGSMLVTVTKPVASAVNLWAPVASGTAASMQGVWGASASSVFAVGSGGTILDWNGASWGPMASGTTSALYDVWGTSPTDVYAVGGGGTILRHNGTNWSPMTSGTTQALYGVWGASRADIFAVGAGGTIVRYDGTSWSAMASGTGQTFNAVWGSSRTNVFAVGNGGAILHYDGTGWTPMSNPLASTYPNAALMDVWGTSPTDVYAVTTYTTNQLLHYNGTAWSTVSPSPYATGVWGTTTGNLFVIGSGGSIQRYDGTAFTPMPSGTTQGLTEVWTNAVSDVTVVGGSGTILRGIRGATATVDTVGGWAVTAQGNQRQLAATARDASSAVVAGVPFSWTSTAPSVATVNGSGLVTAVALGTADIVATAPGGLADTLTVTVTVVANSVKVTPAGVVLTGAGSTGPLTVEVRDGTGAVVPSPTVTWTSANPAVATVDGSGVVTAVSAGQTSVAATSGSMTAYATVTVNVPGVTPVNLWTPMAAPPVSWTGAIWGSSPTNLYVTNGATVLYRYNGTSWLPVTTGSSSGLSAVWGTSATDVFAVGGNGQVAHYDGTTWTTTSSGTSQSLTAVWGASHGDVFAVGTNGAIVHYDGAGWSAMASGTTQQLNGVWGTSRTDVFAAGSNGVLLHYDGSAWSSLPGGGGNTFYAPWGTSGTDVFAAAGGPIFHYDGASWSNPWYICCTNSVWGTSHTDVYSVGWSGSYARFDGSAWTGGTFPGTPTLRALWGTGGSDVLAVGYGSSGPAAFVRGVRGATITVVPAGGWSVTAQGAQQQLADTVKDASGAVIGGVPVTWASRNTAVATVDASGLVTAVALGTDTIVATAQGGATGRFVVTVAFIANSVSVAPLGAAIAGVGTTQAFTATVRDMNGNIVPSPTLTWVSSNPAVATINASGVATAVSAGQTTISATSADGATNYALLTVSAAGTTPVNLWALPASGTAVDLNGVWGSSASDVFAVGGNGTILHSSGGAWSAMASGTTLYLYDVWGTSGTDVYAVGGNGAVLHYNGTSWSAMPTGSSTWLYDIWGSSGKDVFAVGDYGTILHYDGSAWSAMPSGTSQSLQAVWGTSRSNVFAAGYDGALLHFDGTAWSAMPSGGQYFYDLWGTSPTDVYAASGNGLMHYDGSTWSGVSGAGWSQGVWGTAPGELYLPESSYLITYDGVTWRSLGTPRYLSAAWGTTSGSVYLVGSAGAILQGVRGATLTAAAGTWAVTAQGNQLQVTATARDAGSNVVAAPALSWTSTNPAVATVNGAGLVTAVSVGSATIVVTALGGLVDSVPVTVSLVANQVTVSPLGVPLNGVGATWSLTPVVRDASGNVVLSPTVTWSSSNTGVATVNGSGVVTAVSAGQATITATSGGQSGTALVTVAVATPFAVNLWAPAYTPVAGSYRQVFGVWGASPSNVFAVGTSGAVYRFDGSSWSATPNVAGSWQDLHDVWGTSGADVFVVGGGGTILHFDGTTWTAMNSGTSAYLYAVWGSSGRDVYAAGDGGTLLHYDGTGWGAVPTGIPNWYQPKIWGSSSADVWVVSGSANLHFDGSAWSSVVDPNWGYGIWGTGPSDVYMASWQLFRFSGANWSQMNGSSGYAYGVWGSSRDDIYAVRGQGGISSWNGTVWSPFDSVSNRDLWNVWGTATGDVYAVGTNWDGVTNAGIILRGVRGATVAVGPTNPAITGLGTTLQLTATASAGGTPVPGVDFTWSTSDPAVATVGATGLVTAVAAGTAVITATAPGGAAAGTTVTVSP